MDWSVAPLLEFDVSDVLMAAITLRPTGAHGAGLNLGWGTGLVPFLFIGVPVAAYFIWFELDRRRKGR